MISNEITFSKLSKEDVYSFLVEIIKNPNFEFNEINFSRPFEEEIVIDINDKSLEELIQNSNTTYSIILKGEESFGFHLIKNYELEFMGFGFKEKDNKLFTFILSILNLKSLRYIRRNLKEFSGWGISLDYKMWVYLNRSIPEPMEYFPVFSFTDSDEKELSKEHLAFHSHRANLGDELTFEATWQMYFGEIYYKYIPKPLFDAFTNCYENIVLEAGVRRITLYKNPDDFLMKESVDSMWAFRRQLGIDSIAHELTNDGNRIEPLNLPVLITKQNCYKGTTKVTRFLNAENNLVPSNIALKREVKEYLDDGVTVVFEQILLL